ncbi:DUF3027 domain-containing protein [Amycolatopsis australiensis]|uniref:DUF3027 domain-containing protein n=1 Tax=Amycolatopsis australiensis TaxID=546364 RepID=A0A1K1QQP5_9PSEU|nr:DUF3027 domain-containing protein [Amycolatopsis australiensis]SFW62028.1 Protein of unknown function [Amycolatopsis australiensis]
MTLLLTLDDGSVQRKLADAVEFARAAVLEDAPEEQIGAHVGVTREDAVTASHLFEAQVPGYGGWRWSVTVALAGDDEPVTVSEVVLVPGPSALVAPAWVPWERRVRAGDLGVGDIFPTDENDPRLVPAYLQSDDPAVEEVAREAGLGRVHVLSRLGRTEAAARWHGGEFGPRSDMARSAPDVCGTCGFFVPLAGSLRGMFGVCGNEIAPADGHVVDVEYGCGAHSEVEVELTSSVPVAELVYDDSLLDFAPTPELEQPGVAEAAKAEREAVETAAAEPEAVETPAAEPVETAAAETPAAEPVETAAAERPAAEPVEPGAVETPAAEPETGIAESDVSSAEVEPEVAEVAAESVAEPVVAEVPEPAEAEPTQAEVTDAAAEPQAEPAATEPTPAEMTDAAAEPQADPATAEPAQANAAAEPRADEVAAEVPEPAEAEPTQVEVTDAVAEPQAEPAADAELAGVEPHEAAEQQAAEAVTEVPEPAEAESTPAEVTDAAAEPAVAESEAAPLKATGAEVSDVAAEPQAEPAADAELAGVEPHEAAEQQAAEAVTEVPEPVEVEPTQAEAPGDELPQAALTGTVVTQAGHPDEAQAEVDTPDEAAREQRGL